MSWISFALAAQVAFSGPAAVVDGDTLHVRGERVRLFGVDAPELSQMCGAGTSKVACGQLAAQWLKSRVEGRVLRCARVDTDRYGRVVARCSLDGADVGLAIVEAGWATAYRKYSLDYVGAEQLARATRRGIWATGFQPPEAYRRAQREAVVPQSPPDARCAVKGNVNSKGSRIYHLPGSRDYATVRINPLKGERWFCSAAEAAAAGWRPAR
ncbi:MAG: thermonuclease family protein [Rhizorhabdus sp.]|uniref:thermonuclease family protein n=1 Tax=Rhizorhabdus sp. TaxID=1968843 RepID=UPI001B6D574F|nr:thermonuclease family protein [Rhizorhabdus sp.]MBP8234840.1 thermonuclease family protein [Rhizorhabdus sp.]